MRKNNANHTTDITNKQYEYQFSKGVPYFLLVVVLMLINVILEIILNLLVLLLLLLLCVTMKLTLTVF